MKVKFDKLNRYEVPGFVLCNPGSIYKDGALSRVIGVLPYTSDEEIEFNFNATSTLNFRTFKIASDGSPERDYIARLYASLQNRRLIFVENIGFFIITDVQEESSEGSTYKDVTASSCEIEIQNKSLTFISNGTYLFTELFEHIVSTLPKWTIRYIDDAVATKYRTFEDVDTTQNTLSFMMEDMQNAYECIFSFDIVNREISVFDQNNYINKTDIYLSKDDIINRLNIVENSDDHYTALSVFGGEELSISAINPLGGTTIYNFSYYLDWMSPGLREKVVEWAALVNSYLDAYYDINVHYYNALTEQSNCLDEIDRLQNQLDMYIRCRENIVAESSADKVEEFNDAISNNGGETIDISDSVDEMLEEIDRLSGETKLKIQEQEVLLSKVQSAVNAAKDEMTSIHNEVSINNYFSQDEYDELYDYIYEGVYTDDYVITTDVMSTSEKLSQMRELYGRASKNLEVASFPDQEFTIDVEDFIFLKSFQNWSGQLETGCLINVLLDDGDIAELFLTSIRLNWEDKSLTLTFGSRFNKLDPQSLFNDVLGNIQKSANTISYLKEILYPVKSGKLDELEENLQSSKILAVNDVLVSSNGEVLIDGTGYTGRKKSGTLEYSPDQLKITSNTIVVTNDSWSTRNIAVGNISTDDGSERYGLNANILVGRISVGEDLTIRDSYGNDLMVYFDKSISDLSDKTAKNDLAIAESLRLIDSLEDVIGDIPAGDTIYGIVSNIRANLSSISSVVSSNTSAISALATRVKKLEDEK